MKSFRAPLLIIAFLIVLIMLTVCATIVFGKQTQPDPKRVRQIQAALVEHGYAATMTWAQVQEVCRGIARDNGWQTHRAPDARVLIMLGLGNEHSDPEVLKEHHNHLDGGDRNGDS